MTEFYKLARRIAKSPDKHHSIYFGLGFKQGKFFGSYFHEYYNWVLPKKRNHYRVNQIRILALLLADQIYKEHKQE